MQNKNKDVKDIEVKEAETLEPKKKQASSVSYALKAMVKHTKTIGHLMSAEEIEQVRGAIDRAAKNFILEEYGIK